MGYSIAMRAKSIDLQKKMTDFMETNYKLPNQLFKKENNYSRFTANRGYDSRLSYDKNRLAVGFDYNACDPERNYIFAVTRWMALKIGAKKEFKNLGLVPFYVYDGGHCKDNLWPILNHEEWKNKATHKYEWCIVDSIGFRPVESNLIGTPHYDQAKTKKERDLIFKELKKCMETLMMVKISTVNKLIHGELLRLDSTWKNFQ